MYSECFSLSVLKDKFTKKEREFSHDILLTPMLIETQVW